MGVRNRVAALAWRHGRRVRWVLVAICLLLTVVTAQPSDDAAPARLAAVAAHDLTSGSRVEPGDVALASVSPVLDTPAPEELVGEVVRGPVSAGEPLTRSRLVPGRLVAADPGTVVFPLTLADDRIAGLLRSGDHVDVLVAPDSLHEGQPRVAAEQVEVLGVTEDPQGTIAAADSGSVVLLAVAGEQAQALAAIRASDHVTVTIR